MDCTYSRNHAERGKHRKIVVVLVDQWEVGSLGSHAEIV